MDFDAVKTIVDRISNKKKASVHIEDFKTHIDSRTTPDGLVVISVEGKEMPVDPTELKKVIDKNKVALDTTSDEVELKAKVK